MNTVACTACREMIDELAVFPQGVCVVCYEREAALMTPEQMMAAFSGGILRESPKQKRAR